MRYLFLLLMFPAIVTGQCKYDKNEVDEFTGQTIIETKYKNVIPHTLGYGWAVELKAISKDDYKYLRAHISNKGYFSIDKGGYFKIKTDSGSIVELKFNNLDIADSRNYGDSQARSDAYANLLLTESDYHILKTEKIDKIRFLTNDGYVEKEIKNRNKDEIIDLLKCI